MPKNTRGGNKAKKGSNKKQQAMANMPFIKKDIEGGQEYAKVIKSMGGSPPMLRLECYDSKERIGVITGKLKKRIFCNKDDIVLVNLRDYQDSKCDIIWKYTLSDIRRLIKENEISNLFGSSITKMSKNDYDNFDSVFEFDYTDTFIEKKETKKENKNGAYLDEEFLPDSEDEWEDLEEPVDIKNI